METERLADEILIAKRGIEKIREVIAKANASDHYKSHLFTVIERINMALGNIGLIANAALAAIKAEPPAVPVGGAIASTEDVAALNNLNSSANLGQSPVVGQPAPTPPPTSTVAVGGA